MSREYMSSHQPKRFQNASWDGPGRSLDEPPDIRSHLSHGAACGLGCRRLRGRASNVDMGYRAAATSFIGSSHLIPFDHIRDPVKLKTPCRSPQNGCHGRTANSHRSRAAQSRPSAHASRKFVISSRAAPRSSPRAPAISPLAITHLADIRN